MTLPPSIPQKTCWLLQKKLEPLEAPCPVEQWTLLHRWKTINPETVELGTVQKRVEGMFCNNTHVFCGIEGGKVRVYSLSDGQWVRDLDSGTGELLFGRSICGSETYFGIIPSIKPIPHL